MNEGQQFPAVPPSLVRKGEAFSTGRENGTEKYIFVEIWETVGVVCGSKLQPPKVI